MRDEVLVRCRAERIEPPAAGRVDRIVRSALHQAERALTARIVARLPVDVAGGSAPRSRPGSPESWGSERSPCRTPSPLTIDSGQTPEPGHA
ncbi:hypothetical protein AB0F15_21275 [Amycolatopsis sp. NPDC026612]|uniref:hypothetical protein n=1 Tax=Amycolatopsis sp. NPDC026612 TaxID=3155466 RepID=UPI0033E8F447